MKLFSKDKKPRRGERGFFLVIVLLIIAAIMLIYVAANSRWLASLNREIRLVEKRQLQRLDRSPAVITTNLPLNSISSPAAK